VRFKYFCERDYRNFCHNFHNYAQEQELEDTVSGTHRKEQGIRNLIFTTLLLLIILTPHPFLFESPESNQDDTSGNNANSTTMATSNDSKDNNDTIKNTTANTSNKSTASTAAKKTAKQSSNKETTGMDTINLETPPRKKSRATTTALCYSIDTMHGFTINPIRSTKQDDIDGASNCHAPVVGSFYISQKILVSSYNC
jgi:hypothetical protein